MIVFVTITGYDNTFPVLAERMENGFIRIDGKQLRLVAPEDDKPYINTAASYHLHINAYKRKCYDCITLLPKVKPYCATVNTTYVMRVQGYSDQGNPLVLVTEAVKAGLPVLDTQRNSEPDNGKLVALLASHVRFC